LTPEECSAEILKVLFGYLPEEIRTGDTGTVVTVPAAFNQMQRDATLEAARLAGIGKVALMQEPVAAVMAVVRNRQADGTFLIYDLGGGTFLMWLLPRVSRTE
jgi:molecular chaperone DnaK